MKITWETRKNFNLRDVEGPKLLELNKSEKKLSWKLKLAVSINKTSNHKESSLYKPNLNSMTLEQNKFKVHATGKLDL